MIVVAIIPHVKNKPQWLKRRHSKCLNLTNPLWPMIEQIFDLYTFSNARVA
jgi:hypothetical protein